MQDEDTQYPLKSLFSPFTSGKAIHYLILIGFIVYANSLFNGFIADDNGQILDNQIVHSLTNFFTFFSGGTFSGGSTTGAGIYYKPMLSIVFSAIYSTFGAQPFFFHLAQLLLHITNAVLVFLVTKKFLQKPFAFFVAVIFLIHPINSEAVVYISDMQDVLFFFFGILALFLALKKILSTRRIIVIYLLLLLSLLSKESGVLFLFITLIYTYIYNKKYILTAIVGSVSVVTIYSILRFGLAGIYFNQNALNPIMEASFMQRLISVPAIFNYYVSAFFYPKDLLFNQQWVIRQIDFTNFVLPLIIGGAFIVLFAGVVWRLSLKNKPGKTSIWFFSVWFFCGIVLHLQFFPLDATVADRWFYFPSIGILGVIYPNQIGMQQVRQGEFGNYRLKVF